MKKSFILFLLALVSINLLGQQKGTSEIGIIAGFYTSNDFLDETSGLIVTGTSLGSTTYDNATSLPSFGAYYKYAIQDRWFIYADGVFQSITEDVLVNNVNEGELNQSFVTFGVGTEYHYINADWFQMYSGVSVGYTLQTLNYTGSSNDFEDGSDSYFNFQVNALGFRFGKEFAGFVELGVGYRGVANIGVAYQF